MERKPKTFSGLENLKFGLEKWTFSDGQYGTPYFPTKLTINKKKNLMQFGNCPFHDEVRETPQFAVPEFIFVCISGIPNIHN